MGEGSGDTYRASKLEEFGHIVPESNGRDLRKDVQEDVAVCVD